MESKALKARFTGHRSAVYCLESSWNAGAFWSAGGDGFVVEWQVEKPEEGRLLARMPGSVYAICSLPSEKLLVVAVNGDGFHFLDAEAGQEIFSIPAGAHQWFRMKPIAPGKILAAGSGGMLALLDYGSRSVAFFPHGQEDIRSLAIFPDKQNILLGTSAPSIRFLDETFISSQEIPSAHEKTIFGLSIFPDGQAFISAGRDARLQLQQRDYSGNWEIRASVAAHLYGIHDIALHPEKPVLASASMDKTVKIWDAESLRLLRVLDRGRHDGHAHSVNQLCWLADSDLLLSCSDDRSILAWNIYE
jgi:WD40 repeat protein